MKSKIKLIAEGPNASGKTLMLRKIAMFLRWMGLDARFEKPETWKSEHTLVVSGEICKACSTEVNERDIDDKNC